jgi:hypothetical protein
MFDHGRLLWLAILQLPNFGIWNHCSWCMAIGVISVFLSWYNNLISQHKNVKLPSSFHSLLFKQHIHEPKFILSWDYDKALGLGHSRNKGPRISGSQSPPSPLKNVPQPFGFT